MAFRLTWCMASYMKIFKIFRNKKFKHGSLAIIVSIVFVTIVVVFNVAAYILAQRIPALQLDTTRSGHYTLTDETLKYLDILNSESDAPEVEVTALVSEESMKNSHEYHYQLYVMLKKYEQHSNKIKLSFKDINRNPGLAEEYGSLNLAQGDIIVASKLRYHKIAYNDIFNAAENPDGSIEYVSSDAEMLMTNSMLRVTETEIDTIGFLIDHDEAPMDGEVLGAFTEYVQTGIYDVKEQSLMRGEFDENISLLIIAAPKRDYNKEEIQKLEDFLRNKGRYGKGLIYIASPDQPELPYLEDFLKEWGIGTQRNLVFDLDGNNVVGNEFGITVDKASENEWLGNEADIKGGYVFMPMTIALTREFETKNEYATYPLLETYNSTVLAPINESDMEDWLKNLQSDVQSGEIIPQTYCLSAASVRRDFDGTTENSSVVAAFGSMHIFSSSWFSDERLMNSSFVMAVINRITEKEPPVTLPPKSLVGDIMHNMTVTPRNILTVIFVGVLPGLIIISGIVIFIMRRNK